MEPVVSIYDPFETGSGIDEAIKWLLPKLKVTQIDRQGYGRVVFDEHWIRNGLKYVAKDSNEVAAILAVSHVIKRGIEISHDPNHKGRNFSTTTFGAPVELNGKRGNMGVVVKETRPYHYDVHRILTPDGYAFEIPPMENAEPTTEEARSQKETGVVTPISSASEQSIAQSATESQPSEPKKSKKLIPSKAEADALAAQREQAAEIGEQERIRKRDELMRKIVASAPANAKKSAKDVLNQKAAESGAIPAGERANSPAVFSVIRISTCNYALKRCDVCTNVVHEACANIQNVWNINKIPQKRCVFGEQNGAASQIRTGDLILTKDALYLLSYSSVQS